MKRTNIGLAAMVALGAWACSSAVETPKEKPGVMEAAAVTGTATVEKIDYKTREVTLKGEDGSMTTTIVGPEAVRFNEVKKGDLVTVSYLESASVVVQAPDSKVASAEGSQSVLIRNHGKKPSGTKIDTDMITATVEKIDAKKRTATIKSAQGKMMDINIAPDVEHLENVKKGDQLMVKLTRAVTIDVTKPK